MNLQDKHLIVLVYGCNLRMKKSVISSLAKKNLSAAWSHHLFYDTSSYLVEIRIVSGY